MAIKWRNTLWGPELVEEDKCEMPHCPKPKDNSGYGRLHKYCSHHHALKYEMRDYHYKKYREDYCENESGVLGWKCTSDIIFPQWQLSVDHKDGNRKNNDPSNLMTLCHNCHNIKTNLFRDNLAIKYREEKCSEDLIQLRLLFYLGNKDQLTLFDD
jgi:5-methylcytosine-specific restriction endonuclease McrA